MAVDERSALVFYDGRMARKILSEKMSDPCTAPVVPDNEAGHRPETGLAAVRVLRQFRLVFNSVKTHFQQVEREAGLGGAQLWALSIIHARDGVGVSDLARAMDIHQSTASNLVRALTERGLAAVRRDGPDRRTVQLSILPAGQEILLRAPGPFNGVLPQALARLDAATLARLEEDLGRLMRLLTVDEQAANLPLGQ
jgi:MarR family transcriptional regulator, organic hydroperoxide resistance regulator